MAEAILSGRLFQRLCSADLGVEAWCQGLQSAPVSCTSGPRTTSEPQPFHEAAPCTVFLAWHIVFLAPSWFTTLELSNKMLNLDIPFPGLDQKQASADEGLTDLELWFLTFHFRTEPFKKPRSRQRGGVWALWAALHPFSGEFICFRASGCRSHWAVGSFSSKNILSQQIAQSWGKKLPGGWN